MKIILWGLTGIMLILLSGEPRAEQVFDLEFKGRKFSAAIKDIPLNQVLEKIEQEKGVWFKYPDAVTDARVFARFQDKSLEKGLEQIISPLNYSLVFKKGEISGIIIVDKGNLTQGFKLGSSAEQKTLPPSNPFKVIRETRPAPPEPPPALETETETVELEEALPDEDPDANPPDENLEEENPPEAELNHHDPAPESAPSKNLPEIDVSGLEESLKNAAQEAGNE